MKKISYLIIFVCFCLAQTLSVSCKKDHPEDIPEWVKEIIKKRKVDGFEDYSADRKPMLVNEYSFNDEKIYEIYIFSYSCTTKSYFDNTGNKIFDCRYCTPGRYNLNLSLSLCSQTQANNYVFSRKIWEETILH